MKKSLFAAGAAALLLSAPVFALESEDRGDRLRDLDPAMNELLNAKTGIEAFAAADWIVDLGSDAPNQSGWGLTFGAYALPDNREHPLWHTKVGGSFTYFSTKGHEEIGGKRVDETIDAGYAVFEYGVTREFGASWEAGVMLGVGTGAFFGESDDGSSTDGNGNWDWVVQIKPMVAWKPNANLQVFAAYKFAYMSPFYNTTLIGYRSVSFVHSALEVGVSWRF